MKWIICALAVITLVAASSASDFWGLGPSEDTVIISSGDDPCPGTAFFHHNEGFEAAFCWGYGGIQPPYYGAFGEAFDLGAVTIECLSLWLTQIGDYLPGTLLDAYIWEGGVTSEPGGVLMVETGVDPGGPAFWPEISEHDVIMGSPVVGEFTVGYWADFSGISCKWFVASDLDGPLGHPWTNIAPGGSHPEGWQNPGIVWGDMSSIGLGGYYTEGGTPVESTTWGALKGLFE